MSKKFFFLISFLLFPIMVFAKDEFVLDCDKGNYYIDDQFICRVSINQEAGYDEIDFNYEFGDGIELVDVRSNYEKVWQITNDKQVISAKTKSDTQESGLQEYGILLFKAKKDGVLSIKLTNKKSKNSTESAEKTYDDVTAEVKIISTNNSVKDIKINGKTLDGFSNTEKLYNIETTEEKVSIEVETENEFATVTGNGDYTFDKDSNELIIPIKIISENGNQKIIILRFYKQDNVQEGTLKSIIIKDNKNNNLILDFKQDVYEYYLNVNSSITSLEVNPEVLNGEFVKNYGKQTVKLLSGDNVILVRIKDEKGFIRTYFIFVTKTINNASSNNYISNLKIDGYDLEFSKRVKNYVLEVRKNTTKLDITPTLEDENATFIIKGNENITEGSVIKIIVTAENGARATYQITIKYKTVNYVSFLVVGVIVACGLYAVIRNKNVLLKMIKSVSTKNKDDKIKKNTIIQKKVSTENKVPVKVSSKKENKNSSTNTSKKKPVTNKQVVKKNTTKKKATAKKSGAKNNKKKKSSKKNKRK